MHMFVWAAVWHNRIYIDLCVLSNRSTQLQHAQLGDQGKEASPN